VVTLGPVVRLLPRKKHSPIKESESLRHPTARLTCDGGRSAGDPQKRVMPRSGTAFGYAALHLDPEVLRSHREATSARILHLVRMDFVRDDGKNGVAVDVVPEVLLGYSS